MEQDGDAPPTFWFQPPITTTRRRRPPIDPVVLILLPILVLLFLFFFLSPLLSHIPKTIKPTSVKATWDSLNVFLLFFAILCGVLARRNDDATNQVNSLVPESYGTVRSLGSGQWVKYPDRKVQVNGGLRSSSSYPDLRQESLWENDENRLRFSDDFGIDIQYSSSVNNHSRRIEGGKENFSDEFGQYSSPVNNHSRPIEGGKENFYRSEPVSGNIRHRPWRGEAEEVYSRVEKIGEGTIEVSPNVAESVVQPQPPKRVRPPSPPAPAPTLSVNLRRRRTSQSLGRDETVQATSRIDGLHKVSHTPPPHPPPPPPPPPAPSESRIHRLHLKHSKIDRKVSEATKEMATTIASLYNQRKRKRKNRQKLNVYDNATTAPKPLDIEQPPLPLPPPTPPPPPSMFHNMFKKEIKHKGIYSVAAAAPPAVLLPSPSPPPPPPRSIFNTLFKFGGKSKRFHSSHTSPPPPPPPPPPPTSSIVNSFSKTGTKSKRFNSSSAASPPRSTVPVTLKQESKRKSQIQPPSPPSQPKSKPLRRRPASSDKPPLPTKASNYYDRDDFLPSGSQSPLIPIPPPPPPFKMPAMKCELHGDFVRIRSTHSSVCSSPDRVAVDLPSTTMDGADSFGPSPISFPSPDVNAKADSFISRLKDEWRMEKINSIKKKVGPTSSTSPR